jgi:hypothetical protein
MGIATAEFLDRSSSGVGMPLCNTLAAKKNGHCTLYGGVPKRVVFRFNISSIRISGVK